MQNQHHHVQTINNINRKKQIIAPVGQYWQEFFQQYKNKRITTTCDQSTQTDFTNLINKEKYLKLKAAVQQKPPGKLYPAIPTIPGYYCTCTDYLFNDEDINHRSSIAEHYYIFVLPGKSTARIDRNNKVRCSNCDKKLGGWCNLGGNINEPRLRFSQKLLLKIQNN